jgi:hypothetical protein
MQSFKSERVDVSNCGISLSISLPKMRSISSSSNIPPHVLHFFTPTISAPSALLLLPAATITSEVTIIGLASDGSGTSDLDSTEFCSRAAFLSFALIFLFFFDAGYKNI